MTLGTALAELEQALRQDPGNYEIAKNLGNAYKAAGNLEKAAEYYRCSLSLAPGYLPSLYNLGLALHEQNRLDEAEALFRRAREAAPGDADVLAHLGAILCKRSRFDEAAQAFRSALDLAPADFNLWLWLARACLQVPGQRDEAIRCLRQSIALRPDLVEAVEGLGDLLQEEGRLDEAIELYGAALRTTPGSAKLLSGLGCALTRRGRFAEAADRFRKAIGRQPDHAGAHHNLGIALGLQGKRDEALRCAEEAQRLAPDDAAIAECIQYEKQHMCDWSDFEARTAAQRRRATAPGAQPSSPFSLISIPSTRAEQLRSATAFAQFHARALGRDRPEFPPARQAPERLRIGYLSADFHEHATAYLMAELFELHDRRRFEVLGYSCGPDDRSPMRARLARAFDLFTDVASLSHAAAAAAIRADRADILVDLKGYTEHARTGIVALRPAPLQVNYLGYPGTMGADFIDYLVADRFVVPPAHDADYSERLVRLPGCYQVNDRRRAIADTPARAALGLPEQGFVFCSFNHAYKILPGLFALWMRLLAATPGSVLWLLESNPWAVANLRREAGERGIDARRIVFAPQQPLDQHLGRMRAADLFLDTFPCNAHTTASDALWAGLPLLTHAGETFASRVAGSLLTAVGLPELVAGSLADYEALALALARDPARLAELRARLGRNRSTSPLFDTPQFARNLEAAYLEMWRIRASGSPPRAIEL
jgi:protein O-GlcNAc transferase